MNRNAPMAIPELDLFNFEPCNTEVAEVVKTCSEDLDLVFKLEGQLGQLGILRGVCRPAPQILNVFHTKEWKFSHRFLHQTSKIHTRFQTWF